MITRPLLSDILEAKSKAESLVIGNSREGRPLYGYKFGNGSIRISLIGGCHADEPTGPIFLDHLVRFLQQQEASSFLLSELSWWIVPQVNPDGALRNEAWYKHHDKSFDLAKNLEYSQRELPGDDIEFGFPLLPDIKALRPENQAVFDFWESAQGPFDLHVSLHGMLIAYGPWFLIDKDFLDTSQPLMEICVREVKSLNYQLHDVDRQGEKGFFRLAEGFGSRPDSQAMRTYFQNLGQPEMAQLFHASSMESIRSLGENCLTLVTEMPLFTIPRLNFDLLWPDNTLVAWSKHLQHWKMLLAKKKASRREVRQEAHAKGLRAMPLKDQMHLQWVFIWSAISQRYSR